jgi:hypothetical protein
LFNAVKKYGWREFKTYLLETFEKLDEQTLKERELYWIDFHNTCDRDFGYNLRRDSSSGMIVLEETLERQRKKHSGKNNANFGNLWSDEQKQKMAENLNYRRKWSGKYGKSWKEKISAASTELWKDEKKKKQMAENVSKAKEKYNFLQYDKSGIFIKEWLSVKDIIKENPNYKWQNIYAVCNGYKPTYRGFLWKKVEKNSI